MGRRIINDRVLAEMEQLYAGGLRPEEIAERLGFSESGVYKALNRGTVMRRRKKYKKYTAEIRKEMVRLYKEQNSYSAVAGILGVSKTTVYGVVKDAEEGRSVAGSRGLRVKQKAYFSFRCKICHNLKPLSDLVEDRAFRPPIYGCKDCIYK